MVELFRELNELHFVFITTVCDNCIALFQQKQNGSKVFEDEYRENEGNVQL